ncbi:integrase [uncultured Ferrimonas sp.]|uniref:integrase n=1 Tax=uncultured Ferrimonas sp. TaxID=432640 RepID=UPI002633907D|nr:integrase [uncultured Ferrimonas sp.]
MAEIFHFTPKAQLTAQKNLSEFIERCRSELTAFGTQVWPDNNWRTTKGDRTVNARFASNRFPSTNHRFTPFDQPYLDFAKGYIRYIFSHNPVSNLQRHFEALRILEETLVGVKGKADVLLLDGSVLSSLDSVFQRRLNNAEGRNKAGYQMELLLKFCRERLLIPNLPEWTNPYTKVKDLTIALDEKGKEHNAEKLPDDKVMMAVAELFHRAPSLGLETEYYTAVMSLLMVAPSRASETFILSTNCLVHEPDEAGVMQLGIQWVPAKGGKPGVKWVPSVMEPVVREAVKRLQTISKPAREVALFAEKNPNTFFRHEKCITPKGFGEQDALSIEQLNAAIDKKYTASTINTTKWLTKLFEDNGQTFTYAALGEYYFKKCTKSFRHWPFADKDRKVKVADCLLLHRDNEFHAKFTPNPLSFKLLNVNELNNRFGANTEDDWARSLWLKHDLVASKERAEWHLTSHMARHWLSTMSERGGMDELTLANWAGRAKVSDNKKYDNRSEQEKSEATADVMIPEDASVLDKIKLKLPVTYEEIGKDLVGTAIVTELGVCEHDFAMMPCQRNGDCETCKELVCIKGFSDSLELLKRREKEVSAQLERAMSEHKMSTFGADRWVTAHGWRLAHLRTKIRMLEDENVPDGTPVRIPDEYDPSPMKQVLVEKGMDKQVHSQESIEMDDDLYELMM